MNIDRPRSSPYVLAAMPLEKHPVAPRYNARIEDLTASDLFVVRCIGCGRTYQIAPAHLLARFPPYKRLKQVGEDFRCKSCHATACEWHTERAVSPVV